MMDDKAESKLKLVMPLIARIKREHKGESWSNTVECPVCKGTLAVTHAASNGRVWGRCQTEGCVQWME